MAPAGIPQDTELTLEAALAAGLRDQLPALTLISDAALREHTLEKALDRMQAGPFCCGPKLPTHVSWGPSGLLVPTCVSRCHAFTQLRARYNPQVL